MKRIRLLVLFTCVHAIFALGAVIYAMTAGSAHFDNPEVAPAFGASAARTLANVLTLPGALVWTSWASRNLPNVVEWAVFLGNSVVWGALAVFLTKRTWRDTN